MKSITLQTAVLLAIKELLALGGFSAYEVTTLIRQRVDNDYMLSDCEEDANDVTQVYHADVRRIVVELYDNGLFQANITYDRSGQKQFVVYRPIGVAPTAQPITANTPPAGDSETVRKVFAYLKNNGSGTIRQIHSSLKTKGLTYADIAQILGLPNLNRPLSKVLVTQP